MGRAFSENIRRLVGNGNRTLFLEEVWLGDRPLKAVFLRLYRVASDKKVIFERSVLDRERPNPQAFRFQKKS